MRVLAVSLLVAAPALVSALATPIRRSFSGFGTWYYTQTGNAGSCGSYLSDSGYTVAMNSLQYNDGMCGKTIKITSNGKTAYATVQDLCPNGGGNCNYGDVDMSPSLFQSFSSLDSGKIPIQWDFVDSQPQPQPQDPTTTQSSTSTSYGDPLPTSSLTKPHMAVNDVAPNNVAPNDIAPNDIAPNDTPDEQPPTAHEPDAASETPCPTTTSSTDSASAATPTPTPTPTPPTIAQLVAQAMNNDDVDALAEAFVHLGKMLKNNSNNSDGS